MAIRSLKRCSFARRQSRLPRQHDREVTGRVLAHALQMPEFPKSTSRRGPALLEHRAQRFQGIADLVGGSADRSARQNGRAGLAERAGFHFQGEVRNHSTRHANIGRHRRATDPRMAHRRAMPGREPANTRNLCGEFKDTRMIKVVHAVDIGSIGPASEPVSTATIIQGAHTGNIDRPRVVIEGHRPDMGALPFAHLPPT